jgi:hypothetical protein
MGWVLVVILLLEIALPMVFCGMMSALIFVGPGTLKPGWWLAFGTEFLVTVLCFASFFAVGFCFFGVIRHKGFIKLLLIGLSVVAAVGMYLPTRDSFTLRSLRYFPAGWSMLLLVTAMALFSYMKRRETKRWVCEP